MHNPFPRPVCLVGPTASGKTAAALALAQAYPVEIISVDSALVYRGMDIGTAKPTAQEQAQVKHHLLDIRDPAQSYSAAEFARDARVLIEQIQARGALPLLVGGTMLYYKALFEGLDEIPAAQPELRAELEAQAQSQGWPAMHAQLAQVDPATAQRLSPNDAQRIQRALEVYRSSGQPLSSYFTSKTPVQDQALWVALVPQQRSWLHERIALRLTQMFAQGFVDEVQALRARGDLSLQLPSMRCVGYRQVWEALDGAYPLDQAQEKALFATRQLAKRQLTWLRGMTMQHTLACDDPAILSQLMTLIQREQAQAR